MESKTSTTTCECDGDGKVVDRIPEGPWVDKGSYQTRVGGGYSSRLCACRKSLEPREGVARWWTSETTWSDTVELPTLPGEVDVSVRTEVPISEDNYPLIRNAENFYWPSMIEVEGRTMIAADVRKLATTLLKAADKAEAVDEEAMSRA